MKKPFLVFVFLFFVVFQVYQRVDAHEDDDHFLAQTDNNNHRKEHQHEAVVKQNISRAKLNINLAGSTALDFLCQGISFINKLFKFNFSRDLCKDSIPYKTTTNAPWSTTQPTTTKPPPPVEQILSFSDEFVVLTCHHVPGTIKIIEAMFGSASDPSCPPMNVTSYMSQYSKDKTSLMIPAHSGNFGGLCPNYNAPIYGLVGRLSGRYTCLPSYTPGTSMVMDAFEGTELFISCPGGTIGVESAVYGSIDGVTCPPTSVMGYPALNALTTSLTSFTLFIGNDTTFKNLCSAGRGYSNKLSISYHCQQATGNSTFKSVGRFLTAVPMVCPQGEISVTSVISRFDAANTCTNDSTSYFQSLVPPKTTEAFLLNYYYLNPECYNAWAAEVTANYACVGTVSQYTLVAMEFTQMVLVCPYGQKIHLMTSKYYCATNSSETVYQNPAGVVKKCDGKESICFLYVAKWNVLDIPYNSTDIVTFPNCRYSQARAVLAILSITYTCSV